MTTESLLEPVSYSPPDLIAAPLDEAEIEYPESDDEPLAESSIQYRWITTIKSWIGKMFLKRKDVFVAADNFWYPVKGNPREKLAPDIYAVFGAPHKKDRGCYKQWEENNIPIQVVFEIVSPYDYAPKMREKFLFYERHGALEYYVYDPHRDTLEGYVRQNDRFVPISNMDGWVSPLLGVRFEWKDSVLRMFTPDGEEFTPPEDALEQFAETKQQFAETKQQFAETKQQFELANKKITDLQTERDQAAEAARLLSEELDRLRAQLAAAGLSPAVPSSSALEAGPKPS